MTRTTLGMIALALTAATPGLVLAQPPPPGSYQRQCTDIRMNGQFLSATCRGARGGGQSSINVNSCSSDIGVDATGALSCSGPGGAAAIAPPRPDPGYRPPRPGRDHRPPNPPAYLQGSVTVFAGRNWRGQAMRLSRDMPNLGDAGLNDRIRSIQLDRRSGPWLVCSDADYRGRCMTIDRSVADTRQIGMGDSISSLRPVR